MRTKTLRLGSAVMVLPWHNPVLLAEQAATLDLISGGRLDLGIGKGYRHSEFKGFAIAPEEAEARFEEAVAVMTRAWTTRQRFSHHGRFWHFEDIVVEPPPAQKPHPPLWVAAGSEHSIRRAAARGFNLILDQYASTGQIAERIGIYKAERKARGFGFDPMQVAVARQLYVANDEADKQAALKRQAAYTQRTVDVSRQPAGKGGGSHVLAYADKAGGTEENALYGTPDEICAMLAALAESRRRLCAAHRRRRQRAVAPLCGRDHAGLRRFRARGRRGGMKRAMADTLKPRDAAEVEQAIRSALAGGKALEVVGHGTKRAIGRAAQWDATLDLSVLSGVTLYEPEELVLSAQAGTPLAEIEALVAASKQELAFEPMDYGPLLGTATGAATIGGVLAANLSGPRRIKAGAARDHFLGFTAVSGRGETFKSGGRVVKNVTGYDLCKLIAGSWGTLAAMTDVTIKTLPRAETEATVLVLKPRRRHGAQSRWRRPPARSPTFRRRRICRRPPRRALPRSPPRKPP